MGTILLLHHLSFLLKSSCCSCLFRTNGTESRRASVPLCSGLQLSCMTRYIAEDLIFASLSFFGVGLAIRRRGNEGDPR
ncbi:hypothetical protein DL96DRAFT_997366 [Flagelloscypha sp. PMI_526]|nr:hypothetical protein DL96DRAFT_997366 [Flagelloscypha sp. PMI_526]